MTFSGTAGASGTVKIATLEPSSSFSTTVSFIDDPTPGGPQLYAGMDNQELGPDEYILVGETEPGFLLQGGTITIELSNGAEFQAFSFVSVDSYTDATYQSTTLSVSSAFITSSDICMTVTDRSSVYPGAFTVGMNGTWLDLTNATPGDLTMTLSGTAGATGSTTVEQISILSPSDNETVGFSSSGVKVTFSFSKVTDAAKYILQLSLYDVLTTASLPVPVELIPPGTSTVGSAWGGGGTATGPPGFSEQIIGMVFELSLDSATWDVLALNDIRWGVEAYDDTGALIGSTYDNSSTASKYVNSLKFVASNSISMTNPASGSSLDKTDAPSFQWDTYQGASTYTLIIWPTWDLWDSTLSLHSPT